MGREDDGLRQLPHVRGEERRHGVGGELRGIEAEAPDEHGEALGRRHLAVVLVPEPLGLLPAPHEAVDELAEIDPGGEGMEGLVELPRGGADDLALDRQLGQPRPVEAHERVEEVEEHRAVGHGSGFLCA